MQAYAASGIARQFKPALLRSTDGSLWIGTLDQGLCTCTREDGLILAVGWSLRRFS